LQADPPWPLWSRIPRLPKRWSAGLAAACFLLALGCLVPLDALTGPGACAIVVAPVVVAGLLFGAFPGALAGLAGFPLAAATLWIAGRPGDAAAIWFAAGIPAVAALTVVGAVVGRMRDLHLSLTRDRVLLAEIIAERSRAETARQASEERLRLIFEHTGIGVASLDADGVLEQVNPAFDEMLAADDGELRRALTSMARDRRRRVYRELRYRMVDGREAWASLAVAKVQDPTGNMEFSIATVENTTVRKVQEEALEHLALHDTLTGLPNRTLLSDRLRQSLLTGQRERSGVALLIMDLDRFKEVNDSLGHHWGDLLLQQAAARLREALRETDTVARLGGDEFAVILPGVTDHEIVERMGRKLLDALDRPFAIEGRILRVGASVGAAVYPDHGEDVPTLIRHADNAMYAAKRGGTGYALYSDGSDEALSLRLALASELPAAIEQDELVLHFQPKADAGTGRAVAVEALVRWEHPELGLLGPDQFVPLAEETGLIRQLGRWVLDHAIRECARWRAAGFSLPVAVNLSGRDLHDWDLPEFIAGLLARHRLPAEFLELEITETAIMTDPDGARDLLERIVRTGVSVAIDDFGIGYSSLTQLHRLPVRQLKIDKSFIRVMSTDDSSAVIVRSTIDLGHNLGLVVLAEGVEDLQTLEMLRVHGVDLAQGYYLSPPVAGERLLHVLAGLPVQAAVPG
jgi:diguanylate cyclase (GGDEF)-like protein/PAS domain S-box-containing protein